MHPNVYAALNHAANGALYTGCLAVHQHEQHAGAHIGPNQGYAPTAVAGYGQPNPHQSGPQNHTATRRKKVRAKKIGYEGAFLPFTWSDVSQACNSLSTA